MIMKIKMKYSYKSGRQILPKAFYNVFAKWGTPLVTDKPLTVYS